MLHWFACSELKLSACIKMGSGLEGAWFELTGLTSDTRYPPLCSEASSRTLMGSDMDPEWEMLMADHVRKMLPAVHLILSIGLGVHGESGDCGWGQCKSWTDEAWKSIHKGYLQEVHKNVSLAVAIQCVSWCCFQSFRISYQIEIGFLSQVCVSSNS